ncbi:MAG: IgGFc-binding protein [Tannerellaceae bacterium]|jgi:hypothetical protein|nr:IgGFc-binding protein [Tannerellaceae bacterium]
MYQDAHVVITLYNGGTERTYTATIPPGGLHKEDFSDASTIKYIENPRGSAGNVVKYGTHIRSDVRVTAYYMLNHTESRDIFTLKGHQALGTQFYVPMQSDNAAASAGAFEGLDRVDIVATEDNTTVTVVSKARIRIGASTLSPVGKAITRTLNKEETLKILEYAYDESPSPAGTPITSDKPIAVTVTEDLVAGDTSGDQIVPVGSLGTRYVVPRTYLTNTTTRPERFYIVSTTAATTTVKVYYSRNSYTTVTLNGAGAAARYDIPANVYAVYVEATAPVYVYQRGGYGEEEAVLLPSVYAIGQTQMSFYQVSGNATSANPLVQKGFLVFRTGTEAGFTISYGNAVAVPLTSQSGFSIYDIPNVPEWKVARFDFSAARRPAGSSRYRIRRAPSPWGIISPGIPATTIPMGTSPPTHPALCTGLPGTAEA